MQLRFLDSTVRRVIIDYSLGLMLGDNMGDDDELFTITESNLDSGLRGVPVGTCRTSFVDPIEGVHYVGYPVGDLANLEEEDVIYLL